MAPPSRGGKGGKLSIWNHVFVPLVFFSLGMMVALSFLPSSPNCEPTDASDARLVTLMGRINELEDLLSNTESTARHEKDSCDRRVVQIREELQEEQQRSRDAALLKAMPGASGVECPECPACDNHHRIGGEEEGSVDMAKELAEEGAWAAAVAAKGGGQHAKGGGVLQNFEKLSNKWHAADIDPITFLSVFDIGLPTETMKWSGGHLLLPSKKMKNLKNKLDGKTAVQVVQKECKELDVLVLNDGHCVAVMDVDTRQVNQNSPHHISRFLKGGYKSFGKRAAAKAETAPVLKSGFELVSRLTTTQGVNQGEPPGKYSMATHRKALQRFLGSVDDVEKKLKPILKKAATKDKVVITMTMNAGMTDLVSNFYCSARRAGGAHLHEAGAGIAIDHLVLFPTDNEAAAVAEGLGVAFFRHESFGSFPKEEAKNYGDNTFVQMMWIKVLCVYLPLNLGYHVLFQDADIVWLKDPIHEYFLKPEVAGDFDVWFQDDGSRSTRFGPYFSNSGFYFLKHNLRTRQFMNALLFSGDAIIELRSHQSALVQVLADSSSRYGLKVKTLSYADFPSGKEFHHRMPYMKAWMKGTEVAGPADKGGGQKVDPYAFHMCWTASKVDKLKYLQQLGGWFLHPTCDEASIRRSALESKGKQGAKGSLVTTCCSEEPVVTCHFRDKASKHSCSASPSKDKNKKSFW